MWGDNPLPKSPPSSASIRGPIVESATYVDPKGRPGQVGKHGGDGGMYNVGVNHLVASPRTGTGLALMSG